MRTISKVGALLLGSVAGSALTGCFALWLATARADGANQGTVTTVPCSAQATFEGEATTFAVASFPGVSANDLQASVYVLPSAPPLATATIGGLSYASSSMTSIRSAAIGPNPTAASPWAGALVTDGSVAIWCPPGTKSVSLYIR